MPFTKEDIRELIGRYVWAASALAQAGADGIIVRLDLLPHLFLFFVVIVLMNCDSYMPATGIS